MFGLFGKTERTVKRNVIHPLKELFPNRVKYVQGQGELTLFGRTVAVIGANDVGAADKVQGLTLAGSYCNELTLYPENMWQTLIDRHSVDGAQILADCNPDSPYHWLNRDYLSADKIDEFLKRWRFGLADNPVLSERYKRMLIQAHPPGTLWHKRMVLGEWVQAEGAVYEQWDERIHVVERMPAQPEKVVVGVDVGTQNATVFLAAGKVGKTWFIFDEYYHSGRKSGRQKTNGEYSADFALWLNRMGYHPTSIEVDPSAADFKTQLRRDGITRIRDADNSVVEGIRTVSTALTEGTLKVLKRCEHLRAEFPSYVWDPKKQERGEDAPVKANDDCLDVTRYIAARVLSHPNLRALPKPVGL